MATFSNGTTTTSYKYNEDGVRTSKTVGTEKTEFFVDGTTILAQKTGNTTIPFYYDVNGKRIAFKYDDELYFYVYNLQGDVTHILDFDGDIVGEYEYDAWGQIVNLSSLTAIAQVNPFRYRGYYYDTESGLYYLNSRYYNPEWGRFLNADNQISTDSSFTGMNLFAYCGNNPVNRVDYSGHFWSELWNSFTQTLQQYSGYFALAAGVSQLDSPAIGPADIATIAMVTGGIIVCAGIATYTTLTAQSTSISLSIPQVEEKEKEKEIVVPSQQKKQAYFTDDPYDFQPKGLDMTEYPGTSNGRIIKWQDPLSAKTIFEWNEDLKNGAHYHTFMVEWNGKHLGPHYLPNMPVPEPWNTIYFGG